MRELHATRSAAIRSAILQPAAISGALALILVSLRRPAAHQASGAAGRLPRRLRS